jgi:hypothetical protein
LIRNAPFWLIAQIPISPDIDGIVTAGETPVTVAHYLGLTPKWVDGTAVGGCVHDPFPPRRRGDRLGPLRHGADHARRERPLRRRAHPQRCGAAEPCRPVRAALRAAGGPPTSGDPMRLVVTLYGVYDKDTQIDRIIGSR